MQIEVDPSKVVEDEVLIIKVIKVNEIIKEVKVHFFIYVVVKQAIVKIVVKKVTKVTIEMVDLVIVETKKVQIKITKIKSHVYIFEEPHQVAITISTLDLKH